MLLFFANRKKCLTDTIMFSSLFVGGEAAAKIINNKPIDKKELGITALWSVAMGPFISKWYSYLDGSFKTSFVGAKVSKIGSFQKISKATTGLLVTKAIVDVLFDAPIYGSYLLAHHHQDKNYPFWSKFKTMYITDSLFWLPTNMVNFFFVPAKFRVPFYSSAVFIWSIILPSISKSH